MRKIYCLSHSYTTHHMYLSKWLCSICNLRGGIFQKISTELSLMILPFRFLDTMSIKKLFHCAVVKSIIIPSCQRHAKKLSVPHRCGWRHLAAPPQEGHDPCTRECTPFFYAWIGSLRSILKFMRRIALMNECHYTSLFWEITRIIYTLI